MNLFQKITSKLRKNSQENSTITVPEWIERDNDFFKIISKRALNLYERQCDVKKFSKLVLSDPENNSHEALVDELLKTGVKDWLDDSNLDNLCDNQKFLDDLGLSD